MITESSSGATRSRTGLAKLRGDLAASADDVTPPAAAQAAEQTPAETEVRAPASGVVTLERVASPEPGEEPESTPDVPDAPRPPRRLRQPPRPPLPSLRRPPSRPRRSPLRPPHPNPRHPPHLHPPLPRLPASNGG